MRNITFFSIPKPFLGHVDMIQRNSIASWINLVSADRIYLFGNESGVKEICAENHLRQVEHIRCTSLGTPLLSDAFTSIQQLAETELVCYINTDILLLADFMEAVGCITSEKFLMIGRRWNLDIEKPIDFSQGWQNELKREVDQNGKLFSQYGIDFFVFPRGVIVNFPDFAVGRPGWDNWLIYYARKNGFDVIDATESMTAIHQNHDYSHVPQPSIRNSYEGPEADANRKLIGSKERLFSINDSTHYIDHGRIKADFSMEKISARIAHQNVLQSNRVMRLIIKGITYMFKRLIFVLSR